MTRIKWILLVLLSALLGAGLVQYLVCPPIEMTAYLIVTLIALMGLVMLLRRTFTDRRIVPIGFSLVVFVAAYLVTNTLFLNQEIEHPLPELVRAAADPGEGHTAVIYFTHGEPEAYSPNAWLQTMHHLDADNVPFVPKPFRSFFFNGIRSEYLIVGGSIHDRMHAHMIESLRDSMTAQDDAGLKFYLSFLDTEPRPDAAVIEALNEGASRIVIMPVFLTISSHTAEGIELVDDLDVPGFGIEMCVAEPMWVSDPLKEMFVQRANANLGGTLKKDVGIMLIGHGQPEEWDLLYPTQTEQENSFRADVKQLLIAEGYLAENIVLAWMDFKSPTVDEGASDLFVMGVTKLMVFPVPISAESIHTDVEIPAAIQEAGVPDGVEVLNLGAWNDDPLVIEGIRQNILACDP